MNNRELGMDPREAAAIEFGLKKILQEFGKKHSTDKIVTDKDLDEQIGTLEQFQEMIIHSSALDDLQKSIALEMANKKYEEYRRDIILGEGRR
jgi:hypothetical protein